MKSVSFQILRVGLAITFLWIGILILKEPEAWGGLVLPWVANLLPVSLKIVMVSTAFLDIFIGTLLLIDYLTWLGAFLGAFHLIMVLAVSGINAITVRDIGLLAAALSLFLTSFPFEKWKNYIKT